jgi:hypothetical protein
MEKPRRRLLRIMGGSPVGGVAGGLAVIPNEVGGLAGGLSTDRRPQVRSADRRVGGFSGELA